MKGCFFYLYNNYINKKIQIEKSEKYIILCRKINLNLLLFFCYDFNKVLYNSVITFIRLELYKKLFKYSYHNIRMGVVVWKRK